MGTEVATRPPLPPGLAPGANSQGPGRRKRPERERTFSSSRSISSSSSATRVYSRDVQLRIQGKKYSLSSAFVCFGAKIHKRYSASSCPQDDKYKIPAITRDDSFRFTVTPQDDRFKHSHSYDERTKYLDRDKYAQFHNYHFDRDRQILLQEHRRGLSRVTLEEHPTNTLDIVDHQSLPTEFTHKTAEAITSYHDAPDSSTRSSPTITTEENARSSSPSIVQGDTWGTGNTTERSSVDSQYSWDEFDRQAAKTVQNLFDEIDSVLYERRPNQAEYIYNECQEWGSQFPHLRLLGKQMLPVQEWGYELIKREASRPNTTSSMPLMDVTDQDLSGSQESQGLSVSGRRVQAIIPPIEARSRNSGTPSTQTSEFSHLEEEVFDVEGDYEEIIAVDYKDIYEDQSETKKQLTPRRRRVGYPPITPNACLKDTVASSAFDCIWQEIISWIRPLLRKYSVIVLDENKRLPPSLHTVSQALRDESNMGPPSRENSQIRFQNLGHRAHTILGLDSRVESPKLDGLLKISKKIPIQREQSNLVDPSETQLTGHPARPVSSIPIGTMVSKRPSSTRIPPGGRGRGSIRLAPISQDRSKTPSVEEDRGPGALLVKKIHPTTLGRLSSPPYNARNGALPPIGTPLELEPSSRYQIQKKMVSSRASSAVDKDLRVAYKDRYLNSQEARPSTTHAFRSETPQNMGRRASTPFNSSAFNNHPTTRNSYFTGGINLDIRGSGLQPTQDLGHPMNNNFQEILEDPEGLDEHIHPNQWTPSTPSHNNPYYKQRGRQISSLVRS